MNDYTAVVDALDRLTEAVSNSQSIFISECVSVILATIGSVATVIIFEIIRSKYFAPTEEFKRLRRKVNTTLNMYACYYTNQIDIAREDAKRVELYSSASKSMREVAVELMAFADDASRKRYCGIEVGWISEASRLLIGLSNSFFTPYNCPEMTENRDNDLVSKQIKTFLGIAKKK